MIAEEQQIQYDIYYQGSVSELYALLYPLTGPNSAIFQHLKEDKVQFDPNSKSLDFTYCPQNFQNIDKQKQQIKYKSKPIESLSNYFYSTFNQDTGSFVWRNLNGFLQMRPQNRQSEKSKLQKIQTEKIKKQLTKQNIQNIDQRVAKVQLQVIQSGQVSNFIQKQILQAPLRQVKQTWYCSKQQYFTHLAN